MMVNNYNTH